MERRITVPVKDKSPAQVISFKQLGIIGAFCFRFLLCPGDDILAVTSIMTLTTDQAPKAAVLPKNEVTDFINQLKKLRSLGEPDP